MKFMLEIDNYYDVQRAPNGQQGCPSSYLFHGLLIRWWTGKNMQKPKVVANLSWVGFMEFFIERFTPDCQELHKGVNLMQMRHTKPMCVI